MAQGCVISIFVPSDLFTSFVLNCAQKPFFVGQSIENFTSLPAAIFCVIFNELLSSL